MNYLTCVWAPIIVCVETELAGLMLAAFEGSMFSGLVTCCLGWMFSLAGLGLAICWTAPCVAIASA